MVSNVTNVVETMEYKGTSFKTDAECVEFLDKYSSHINSTLTEHLRKNEPNSVVLFVGCTERNKVYTGNETTT